MDITFTVNYNIDHGSRDASHTAWSKFPENFTTWTYNGVTYNRPTIEARFYGDRWRITHIRADRNESTWTGRGLTAKADTYLRDLAQSIVDKITPEQLENARVEAYKAVYGYKLSDITRAQEAADAFKAKAKEAGIMLD